MKLKPPVCILPKCKTPANGLLCAAHWEPLDRELRQKLLDEKRAIERGGWRMTRTMTRLVLEAQRVSSAADRPVHDQVEP